MQIKVLLGLHVHRPQVAHGAYLGSGEEDLEHRAGVQHLDAHALLSRKAVDALRQTRAERVDMGIDFRPTGLQSLHVRAARRHAQRISREAAPGENRARVAPQSLKQRHDIGATGDRANRDAAAQRLAVGRQVRLQCEVLLGAAVADAKTADHLVDDEKDAVSATKRLHLGQEVAEVLC